MENVKKSDISILAPVFNEEDNLKEFHAETVEALDGLKRTYEIIYIDDGSTDRSLEILRDIAKKDSHTRVITFTRNFGQTAAISAGIKYAGGEIIIPIDTDLQNDPRDIARLLEKMEEGYDVVSGWRRDRKDPFFSKKLPSLMANRLISTIGGLPLHDYGCSLKAYRRDVIKHVRLYGEMHRFIPLYAHWVGARTIEIPVNHRPRTAGKSKYGLTRIYKVMLDLITTKFLGSYSTKPIYFFGSIGFILDLAGLFFGFYSLYDRYILGVFVHRNPKILLAIFLFILGFQFIMLGLLAEMLMRTYYESQDKNIYFIKDTINIEKDIN